MRNALAQAGRQGRRVVSAIIATASVRGDAGDALSASSLLRLVFKRLENTISQRPHLNNQKNSESVGRMPQDGRPVARGKRSQRYSCMGMSARANRMSSRIAFRARTGFLAAIASSTRA